MKKTSEQSSRKSDSQANKGPGLISLIGIFGIVISILLGLIVVFMSTSGDAHKAPIVVFAGEYVNFPYRSMGNSLMASGFQMEIQEGELDLDSDDQYIIVGVGDNSFEYVCQYRDNPSVLGFVLLCPSFPDGSKVNGMNAQVPAQDIAIFAGRDDVNAVSDIGEARMIYERLSGDDTVYGTPIIRGGLFASKCFINNGQNRMLSLSYFNVNNVEGLLFSPLFQNELAGYLSVSYGDSSKTSFARINAYYVLTLVSIVLAMVSFCFYLAGIPVSDDSKKQSFLAIMAMVIASCVVGGAMTLGCFIPKLKATAPSYVPYLPAMIMAASMIVGGVFTLLIKNDGGDKLPKPKRRERKNILVQNIILAALPLVLLTEYAFILSDMHSENSGMIVAVSVIDMLAAAVIMLNGNKYRFITVVMSIVVPVALLVLGSITSNIAIVHFSGVALAVSLLSNVVTFASRRHGSNPFIYGLSHGLATMIILMALL